jgi:hypothetical protein
MKQSMHTGPVKKGASEQQNLFKGSVLQSDIAVCASYMVSDILAK